MHFTRYTVLEEALFNNSSSKFHRTITLILFVPVYYIRYNDSTNCFIIVTDECFWCSDFPPLQYRSLFNRCLRFLTSINLVDSYTVRFPLCRNSFQKCHIQRKLHFRAIVLRFHPDSERDCLRHCSASFSPHPIRQLPLLRSFQSFNRKYFVSNDLRKVGNDFQVSEMFARKNLIMSKTGDQWIFVKFTP